MSVCSSCIINVLIIMIMMINDFVAAQVSLSYITKKK